MAQAEPLIRSIPLDRLELAPENVRKTPPDPAFFAELKASIAAHGLMKNLVVRTVDPGGDPGSAQGQASGERCAVVAGGCRLAAMNALAEEGVLDADHTRSLPRDRRGGERRRTLSRRERGAPRHAPRRPGRRVREARERGYIRIRHRGALRHDGAHGRAAPESRRRRTRTARRLPGQRDGPGHPQGLHGHDRPRPPNGGLGAGEGIRATGPAAGW